MIDFSLRQLNFPLNELHNGCIYSKGEFILEKQIYLEEHQLMHRKGFISLEEHQLMHRKGFIYLEEHQLMHRKGFIYLEEHQLMHRKGFISIAINCVQYVKSLTEL
jgi:hemerythrin